MNISFQNVTIYNMFEVTCNCLKFCEKSQVYLVHKSTDGYTVFQNAFEDFKDL